MRIPMNVPKHINKQVTELQDKQEGYQLMLDNCKSSADDRIRFRYLVEQCGNKIAALLLSTY